jgi:hypothetical protein
LRDILSRIERRKSDSERTKIGQENPHRLP